MRFEGQIAIALIALLLWPSALFAQQPTAVATTADGLKIVIVRGENSKNDIRVKSAEELVVKVIDAAEKPVSGAEVVFQAPSTGPSGRFYDWLQTQTVKTDAEGIARAKGFTPNDEAGRWHMRVLANQGALHASTLVPQTNLGTGGGGSNGKSRKGLWIAIGVIGAAAIAGGVVAARGGDSVSATPSRPVVIAPGPITVGGPR